jgi:hypothetical protein
VNSLTSSLNTASNYAWSIGAIIGAVQRNSQLKMLADSGAATHVCPLDFCSDVPIDDFDEAAPLKSATGEPLVIHGTRLVTFEFRDTCNATFYLTLRFVVTDVTSAIVSLVSLANSGFVIALAPGGMTCSKNDSVIQLVHENSLAWFVPLSQLPHKEALAFQN